jgi:hypothetical protein
MIDLEDRIKNLPPRPREADTRTAKPKPTRDPKRPVLYRPNAPWNF